jgi:hypothetical protein
MATSAYQTNTTDLYMQEMNIKAETRKTAINTFQTGVLQNSVQFHSHVQSNKMWVNLDQSQIQLNTLFHSFKI